MNSNIEGIKIGHWTESENKTGCTTLISDKSLVASVDIRGGAPGTKEIALLDPIATFKEKEGLTLVITEERAKQENFEYNSVFKCISLGAHSSLTSVGLIATISKLLSKKGISCNVFSGYFHDHLFVQKSLSKEALELLQSIKPK